MIALDEDQVGSDNNTIIAQGLKVCLGLFIQLNNGTLLGAHFTPGTPLGGMNLIMRHIAAQSGGNIAWMGMIAKFSKWSSSSTGLTSKEKLAAYFRTQTLFAGAVTYGDLDWAAHSYDIRFTTGISPRLEYRATPDPNNCVSTPLPNVLKLTNHATQLSATNGPNRAVIHNVPSNLAGFALLSQDLHTIA